jgi:hypothetical protein
MSTNDDFERISNAWLADGPTELADRVLDAALHEVHLTHQRRRLALWRTTHMSFLSSNMARLAAVVVVAIVALGGAFYLLGPNRGGVGGPVATPTPTPPTTAPSPSAVAQSTFVPIDTTGWTTYTSTRYGFSIGRPPGWTVKQRSDHAWTLAADFDWQTKASEGFTPADTSIYVTAWSVAVPAGMSADAWIQAYCLTGATGPCTGLQAVSTPVTMDGHPGVLIETNDTEAFTLVGGRMYVVALWEAFNDPAGAPYLGNDRLLKGFVSTMHLLPGGPAASPTPRAT